MDGHRFDELARTLARGGLTRRGILKALGGGLLGGLLGAAGGERAGAYVCRAGGVLCLHDWQCCSGACDQATHRCTPACRGAGHPCEGNQDCCAGLVCAESGPGAALRCAPPTFTTTTTPAPTTPPPTTTTAAPTTTSTTTPATTTTTSTTPPPTTSTTTTPAPTTTTTTTAPPSCPSGTTPCNGGCVTNCTHGYQLNPTTCTCECPSPMKVCPGYPSFCVDQSMCCSSADCVTSDCRQGTCCTPLEASEKVCIGYGACYDYNLTCVPSNPCETATCSNGTCTKTEKSCSGCMACDTNSSSPTGGQCAFDTCRANNPCQYCDGTTCQPDESLNYQSSPCTLQGGFCYDGQCVPCVPFGGSCNAQPCCHGTCNYLNVGGPVCTCNGVFSGCSTGADCCSGICSANTCLCSSIGGRCSLPADCCAGGTCSGGFCVYG